VPSSAQIIVQPPAIFKSLRALVSQVAEHVDRHDTGMVKPRTMSLFGTFLTSRDGPT
jgi:hypothetical protein